MKILCKQSWFIFLVVAFSLGVKKIHSAGTNGQKAHFQVEDKSGDLKITATKDLAKVTAQADSVQVVVKPGMAEYPVLKSDKPIVHVVNGWNTMSFRKSFIPEKVKKINNTYSGKEGNKKARTRSDSVKSSRTSSSFVSTGKLAASKSKFNRNSQRFKSQRKNHRLHLQEGKKGEVLGSKKSNFETGFRVTGTAGKLKMDVTKKETEVLSESGTLDVFLKQKPASKQTTKPGNDVSGRNADQIQHGTPEWHVINDIGLRKSLVPVKGHRRHSKM
ncbi:uncharacterized protein LOC116296120 [Actinia tenebrosa]|uniref:Uncharacterized protein LOC116296120 n=1 Tax=Actinia tenebrosa TaxID=6105 RepID=A0A6P8HX16_ACTTE|nr:uncharacterized protein LOC116296120 [Actinia tenebrosa]